MRDRLEKAKDTIRRYYVRFILAVVGILVLYLFFGPGMRFIIVAGVFVTIGSLSTWYQYFFKSPLHFELIKFATVMTAVTFGAFPAALVGILASFISKIISGRLEADFIGSILAISAISVLSAAWSSWDIVTLGIVMTVVYHLIIFPIALMMGGNIGYGVIYSGSNIVFNIIVFNLLARPTLFVLKNILIG